MWYRSPEGITSVVEDCLFPCNIQPKPEVPRGPLPDVPHVPSSNISHCAADAAANWTIPPSRYLFLDSGLEISGDLLEGTTQFVDIDFPLDRFNQSSGELFAYGFPFDYNYLKIVIGKGAYLNGGVGTGIDSTLEMIYSVPYMGILSVDGKGNTCISLPEFAQETEFANIGHFGGESTYLSLFAGEDRPILLRSGDTWTSEIYKTIKSDANTIRWHYRYQVTNYGIWEKAKIRSSGNSEQSQVTTTQVTPVIPIHTPEYSVGDIIEPKSAISTLQTVIILEYNDQSDQYRYAQVRNISQKGWCLNNEFYNLLSRMDFESYYTVKIDRADSPLPDC